MVFLRKRSLLLGKCNVDDFLVQSAYNRKRTKKTRFEKLCTYRHNVNFSSLRLFVFTSRLRIRLTCQNKLVLLRIRGYKTNSC